MKLVIEYTMNKGGNLKLHSFDLADEDRGALAFIRETLGISSNALAVRMAIRELANRLKEEQPRRKGEPKLSLDL
jgi:hypothetical protein